MWTEEEIRKKIESVPSWWHRIDLKGVVTPGITPKAAQAWIARYLDSDFSGLDVLDIGAWDGAYSFMAEARGARRVVAIDPSHGVCRTNGFFVAKEILGSNVIHQPLDVYQLDQIEGQFDRIFFFGVYYHLGDPILAFHQIFKKLKPGGIVLIEGLVRSGSEPYLQAYRPGIDLCPGDFCAGTVPWLLHTCEQVGFHPVAFLSRYPGDNPVDGILRSVAWRLRLHAGRLKRAHRAMIRAVRPRELPVDFATNDSKRDVFLGRFVGY